MNLNPGVIVADRYEILEKIGSGGMAFVYRAKDNKLDRQVTLKIMREEYMTDEEFINRFGVEARAAGSLSNQNIVNIYDVGYDGSVHYIVMEFIDGVTLKDLINRRAPFLNEEILGVAIQIASAIRHAHDHKVIHRDIKPQNILVTTQGIVKVTDFGIARSANVSATKSNDNIMGSVHYFSPEQARGFYVDHKSDIYSLGIVMYEMATGLLPYDGETAVVVALKQINDPLPLIKEINPNISDSVEKIILKATEKNTSKRYQNAVELLVDLKKALTDASGSFVNLNGAPDSPTVRISKGEIELIKRETPPDDPIEATEEDYGYEEDEYEDDEYEEPPKKRAGSGRNGFPEDDKSAERKIIIAAVVTALAIIILLASIIYYIYNNNLPSPIPAPNVVGYTFEDARASVEDLGLKIEKSEAFNEEFEEGTVISQIEEPGDDMYRGYILHVVVSLGSEMTKVPSVTGLNYDEAVKSIRQSGFSVSEEFEYNENARKDTVYKQIPEAGELVAPDTLITILISMGPPLVSIEVPDLVGRMEADIVEELQELGLTIGRSSSAHSDEYPEGVIIRQTLRAGSRVTQGAEITYVISLGAADNEEEQTQEPEATPEPTPTPTPVEYEESTKTIFIDPPRPEGATSIFVRVYKITNRSQEIILDREFTVLDFPHPLDVTGYGIVEIQVYVSELEEGDYQIAAREHIDFNGE